MDVGRYKEIIRIADLRKSFFVGRGLGELRSHRLSESECCLSCTYLVVNNSGRLSIRGHDSTTPYCSLYFVFETRIPSM